MTDVQPQGPVYLAPPPNKFARGVEWMVYHTPRWVAPAAIVTCFAGAASYVLVSNPTDAGAADPPTCIIKLLTGFDCPGCGGTRAFYYLMTGNIPEAARHHAIAVFAAPFLVWLFVAWTASFVFRKKIPAPRISTRTISVFLSVWAAFTVLRNIPFAPFTALFV